MSKYELTQAQWIRIEDSNPSFFAPDDDQRSLLNPVENVSWNEVAAVLDKVSLVIPTESQWEYAARAGVAQAWWVGSDYRQLEGVGNFLDKTYVDLTGDDFGDVADWFDGFAYHAPVGSFRANPNGFYDMLGNVAEMCRDTWTNMAVCSPRHGDGLRTDRKVLARSSRGGWYEFPPHLSTPNTRFSGTPNARDSICGVRPARSVN